ncbi:MULTISPECIES: SPOR domain-containing protein [Xanthomonas]|uniref:SPOR domain-containing protein n=1 Tax=Xanthomonas TaxID=338 RepID=UPI001ADA5A20|nr:MULTISPECIES: SPOR domain-containing protein [unclassified Xanthomonas]MBO9873104.1 SPOR domain-containing protein [Xanthomonas sp. D-93]WNH44689.1 SPOR domain-containing protein [Xanthomonas sp. A6251]
MLVRALLVVLTILNLGVAVWWAMQPPMPPPVPMPAVPAGVATLQLVNEAPAPAAAPPPPAAAPVAAPAAAQADTAVAADAAGSVPAQADAPAAPTTAAQAAVSTPPAAAPAPAPTQAQVEPAAKPAADAAVCLSVGPYPDRDAAQVAVAALAAGAPRPRLREAADSDATSFRVILPTIGGEDGLRQATERIVAAGIRDYYPLRQGEAGNAIALGQYRSREGAERRRAELARAGFNADLIPSGGSGQSRWWLDLRADSAAQAATLRRQLGAARQRNVDCATLR